MKEKIKQWMRYHALQRWFGRYERWLMPATLVFGVAADAVTFATIDTLTSFILFGVYAVLAGAMIAYQHAYDADRIPKYSSFRYLRLATPLVIQFAFGALLSGSFVFYFFSGTIVVSWPFIAILVVLMISNDVFRRQYLKPVVQVSVYFFILFSLSAIILPFAFSAFGPGIFLLSGGVSVIIIAIFLFFLEQLTRRRIARRQIMISLTVIFIVIHGLYFLQVIPPIPLALRDAEVAHNIVRSEGAYTLSVEDESIWQKFFPGKTIRVVNGGRVYVYTAIFAPENLTTDIIHHWQYFDESKSAWVTRDRLSFPLTGGARRGYRGYSFKTSIAPGRWRVDVETPRGQVLGRVRFSIRNTATAPDTHTIRK